MKARLVAPALILAALAAWALPVPPLVGRVNDLAGLLSATERAALEERLARFEEATTTQIVVLTVPSLQGDPIEDFGIRVAEAWKIGQKGKDNGAILIVAREERKIRIEVGYGLEGALPDAIASRIIRERIAPAFRNGDYPGGIAAGVEGIMRAAHGEYPAAEGARRARPGQQSVLSVLMTVVFAILVLSTRLGRLFWPALFFSSMARGRRGGFGGRIGGGFGGGGFSGGGGGFGGGGASGSW